MVQMLSPGVYTTEIDASTVVPTVSSTSAVFAGKFDKGPVEAYSLITSVEELIDAYGYPQDNNYNDWFQCYNFLQYGNTLYVARAANTDGNATAISGEVLASAITADSTATVSVSDDENFTVGELVSFGGSETDDTYYMVTAIDDTVGSETITLDRNIEDDLEIGDAINTYIIALNGVFEAVDDQATGEAVTNDYEYLEKNRVIENSDEYEYNETSIAFTNTSDSKIKIMARNVGDWSEDLQIAIAKPEAFDTDSYAFDGVALDDLYEYFPTGTEVGIMVYYDDEVQEIFTCDFDVDAVDENDKSTYIETVINNNSEYIFVKDNTANDDDIKNYIYSFGDDYDGDQTETAIVELVLGTDSAIQDGDLLTAYELWENKEEIDKLNVA